MVATFYPTGSRLFNGANVFPHLAVRKTQDFGSVFPFFWRDERYDAIALCDEPRQNLAELWGLQVSKSLWEQPRILINLHQVWEQIIDVLDLVCHLAEIDLHLWGILTIRWISIVADSICNVAEVIRQNGIDVV